MPSARYAVYLRPASALEAAVAAVHRRMERRWGLVAAGRFMPHVTLKGFFATEADPAELERRAWAALRHGGPLAVHQTGVTAFGTDAVVLDVDGNGAGARNEALHALHVAMVGAMAPAVAPGCRFSAAEHVGDAFHAHVTLAMADIPSGRFAEVLADARSLEPIGPPVSTAAAVQLAAFESAAWDGAWWETLSWRVLAEHPLEQPRAPARDAAPGPYGSGSAPDPPCPRVARRADWPG